MNLFSNCYNNFNCLNNFKSYLNQYPLKRVLITGAGSGLGRSLAIHFAKLYWNVFILDINKKTLDETQNILNLIRINNQSQFQSQAQAQSQAQTFDSKCFDINDIDKTHELVDYIFKSSLWNGIDIVINNAAMGCLSKIENLKHPDVSRFFNTNLVSPLLFTSSIIPHLKKQGHGHIVNISSVLSFTQTPEMGHYSMAKAALNALSETLYMELKPYNISVSIALPYYFKSNIINEMLFSEQNKKNYYQKLMGQNIVDSDVVARNIIKCLRKDRLYIFPQIKGRILWYLKRLFPKFLLNVSKIAFDKQFKNI